MFQVHRGRRHGVRVERDPAPHGGRHGQHTQRAFGLKFDSLKKLYPKTIRMILEKWKQNGPVKKTITRKTVGEILTINYRKLSERSKRSDGIRADAN